MEKISFSLLGGQKSSQGGGLCFLGSAYGNPPLPPPLALLWDRGGLETASLTPG